MVILMVFLLCAFLMFHNSVVGLLYGDKPKVIETEAFNHKTKMLEIECFGQKWWEEFGTECKCEKCVVVPKPVPPKGPGGGSKKVTELKPPPVKSRIEFLDGYQFTRPSDVPDNAHVEIYPHEQYHSDFSSVMFTWIDEKTGRHLALRAVATRDQFKAIHAPEFFTANERREILQKKTDTKLHKYDEYVRNIAQIIKTEQGYK